ncbi:PREDICTED: E3 ubiquitin-protein ligase CHFR [Theobroma cacao]|uniref:E3 ubiquitin-protein ligase CHFR n=1 Tax=Theobroma cacao TaxID=3641 RepID=A0AB32VTK1_THECC|nr:PREDICTED: E3 ubiquitin-protein ligase CHFR [Theobroma cacao]
MDMVTSSSTAEVGESSTSKPTSHFWAKLVPLDAQLSDVEICSNEMIVSSQVTSSSQEKHEWCRITRNPDLLTAMMKNKSSNDMLVDDAVVQREDVVEIKCGTEIVLGPNREGYLSYKFKLMPGPETCKRQLKICVDVEHAKCSICLNIWHDVVTIAPCLHNFCNGCFSEWLKRSQKKHSSVLCPQCRAVVQFAGRNHFLWNIEEDILRADPSLRRSNEEVALIDSYATIRSNLVIRSGRGIQRKRAQAFLDEVLDSEEYDSQESDDAGPQCPQCGSEIGGFQCNQHTIHLQCQVCGGMMPSRADMSELQHCMGCDRTFCGAYWHAQTVTRSDFYPVCNNEIFRPISEHTITGIPFLAHEMNRHEQDITERCIRQTGRTLQEVVAEWIRKLNNREIDRTRMPLNHAERITAATHVCSTCYEKLVSFLLYWFRISIPKYLLPPDALQREDCWYGYACRTQHHNEEHARKRNHVCRPTRGANV